MIKIKVRATMEIADVLGTKKEISLPEGSTVGDFLSMLEQRYGEPVAEFLYESDRDLAQAVLLNGRNIAFMDGKETVLKDGDELFLVPIFAGG